MCQFSARFLEASIIGGKGLVYAIEPAPNNVELLRKNIALNNYSNVEVYQLAIGSKTGTAPFYVSRHHNRSSMNPTIQTDEVIQVDVTTLDDFLKDKPYPDLLRMDVEGFEYEIIKGMPQLLNERKPLKLFIEMHFRLMSEQQTTELLTTLKNSGFEITFASASKRGMLRYKQLSRLYCLFESKLDGTPKLHGTLNLTIDQILENKQILRGDWGALELFFQR